MTEPDELDLSPADSLLLWVALALAFFGISGFAAGVLYSYY